MLTPLASQGLLLDDYEKHSMSQAGAKSEPTVMPRAVNLTKRIYTLGHIEESMRMVLSLGRELLVQDRTPSSSLRR